MLLDTLMVKITGDASGLGSATSKAKSDIGGLGDSAEGAGGKFSTFFQSVKSSAFGNIIADMAQTAISALSDLSSEALEASDSTQKFAQTMDFAGVDASKIEELTASTQKYADDTVYGLSDIRNITAQLASNGVPSYEKLAEAAGNLNAVAGGTADTYKSVGMVLTQTAGQGKLTTENWNQLSDAIPGASGKLQQALLEAGAYTGNFRDAMAAGEITADEFNDAILNLGLTDVAREAATATTTWEGAFGNLEAACVNLMTQGLDLIKPAATAAINGLTDAISAIPNAIGTIGGTFSELKEWIADFENETDQAATAGEVMWEAIQLIGQKMGFTFEQLNPIANSVSSLFDTVQTAIMNVGSTVESNIAPFVSALQELGNTIASNVLPMVTAMVEYFSQVGSTLTAVLTPVLNTIIPIIIQIGTMIVQQITNIISVVMPTITNIYNLLTQVVAALQPILVNAMNFILGIVNTVWPSIQSTIQGAMNAIQAVISTVMGVIQGIIQVVLGIIQGDWSGVMSGLQQIASSIWDGIKGVISGAIQAVQGIVSSNLGIIQGVWSGAWNAISSFLSGAWDSIKNGVSSGIDGVIGFMQGLPGRILNALGNLGTLLLDAGKSIMKGLLDGITSGVQGVFDFVSGIGNTIASLKGPIPYDLKLLIPNGQAIMESLLTGINNGVTGVFNRVSNIGGEIADSLSGDYTIPVTPKLKVADFNGVLPSNMPAIDSRPVVNEAPVVNVKNIIVRSDEDFDSAATVFNRNIMHELNWSQYAQ